MSIQRYFKILGIPPTKNEKVIKRAYRKKAMMYHPDRNPSDTAKNKFIQITEAYDQILIALTQAEKTKHRSTSRSRRTSSSHRTRTAYQGASNGQTSQQSRRKAQQEPLTREEKVKEARRRYEYMKRKEAHDNEVYFKSITTGKKWKRFKTVVMVCTFLSLLISLDINFFPSQLQATHIVKKNPKIKYAGSDEYQVSPVKFSNGQKAWIPVSYVLSENTEYMFLERTLIFKDIVSIKTWKFNDWEITSPSYSMI